MPVATQLNVSGNIALALEFRTTPYSNPIYNLSLSYSSDNWATPLGQEQTGPADKQVSLYTDLGGPYLRQFPSGETVLTYNKSSVFTFRIGDSAARIFGGTYQPFSLKGYWGSVEIIAPHTVIGTFPNVATVNDTNDNKIQIGRLYLNHLINAKTLTPIVDGRNTDWKNNTDALFIGSKTQAQVALRVAQDNNNISFLVERLDYKLTSSDTVILYVGYNNNSAHYKIELGLNGITGIYLNSNGTYTPLSASSAQSAVTLNGSADNAGDTDEGYIIELSVPRSLIGAAGKDTIQFNAVLYNKDGGESPVNETFINSALASQSTWIPVKFTN
jgi:hypothetical protein